MGFSWNKSWWTIRTISIQKNYTICCLFLNQIAQTDVFVHGIACPVCHRVQRNWFQRGAHRCLLAHSVHLCILATWPIGPLVHFDHSVHLSNLSTCPICPLVRSVHLSICQLVRFVHLSNLSTCACCEPRSVQDKMYKWTSGQVDKWTCCI